MLDKLSHSISDLRGIETLIATQQLAAARADKATTHNAAGGVGGMGGMGGGGISGAGDRMGGGDGLGGLPGSGSGALFFNPTLHGRVGESSI